MLQIGEVVAQLGVSADTLRYYEKIALMPRVHRDNAGVRLYSEEDLARLRFIRRAQKMRFSLKEIARLLEFREAPHQSKPGVHKLARQKLTEIEKHLGELGDLRDELRQLTHQCGAGPEGKCPILDKINQG